jgi:hypothetical protein
MRPHQAQAHTGPSQPGGNTAATTTTTSTMDRSGNKPKKLYGDKSLLQVFSETGSLIRSDMAFQDKYGYYFTKGSKTLSPKPDQEKQEDKEILKPDSDVSLLLPDVVSRSNSPSSPTQTLHQVSQTARRTIGTAGMSTSKSLTAIPLPAKDQVFQLIDKWKDEVTGASVLPEKTARVLSARSRQKIISIQPKQMTPHLQVDLYNSPMYRKVQALQPNHRPLSPVVHQGRQKLLTATFEKNLEQLGDDDVSAAHSAAFSRDSSIDRKLAVRDKKLGLTTALRSQMFERNARMGKPELEISSKLNTNLNMSVMSRQPSLQSDTGESQLNGRMSNRANALVSQYEEAMKSEKRSAKINNNNGTADSQRNNGASSKRMPGTASSSPINDIMNSGRANSTQPQGQSGKISRKRVGSPGLTLVTDNENGSIDMPGSDEEGVTAMNDSSIIEIVDDDDDGVNIEGIDGDVNASMFDLYPSLQSNSISDPNETNVIGAASTKADQEDPSLSLKQGQQQLPIVDVATMKRGSDLEGDNSSAGSGRYNDLDGDQGQAVVFVSMRGDMTKTNSTRSIPQLTADHSVFVPPQHSPEYLSARHARGGSNRTNNNNTYHSAGADIIGPAIRAASSQRRLKAEKAKQRARILLNTVGMLMPKPCSPIPFVGPRSVEAGIPPLTIVGHGADGNM